MTDVFIEQGYAIFKNILPVSMLERLRTASDEQFVNYTDEQRKASGGQGSIVAMPYLPEVFSELIAHPPALDALRSLGFDRPRFWSGYLIAKEPNTPPSYWHQDWPYWGDPVSADPIPHQLFLMYYLVDTTPQNGCLRVIPGSHQRRFPQHDMGGHDAGTRYEDPATSPAYASTPVQADASVKAGDLLVGDARILHAPHGNRTDQRRTVITMWFLPRYDELPERMQAAYQRALFSPMPDALPDELKGRLSPLQLDYDGDCPPTEWDRIPGEHLHA